MKKRVIDITAMAFLICIWTITSVQAFEVITQEMMEEEVITETDLIRIADNFIVVFDASSSANSMVPGLNISRIQATKQLLMERNAWLPDLGYTAGLFKATSSGYEAVYPLLPYNREGFAAALEKLPDEGSGPTMAQQVFHSLREPIAGLSGRTAVILFTDGAFSKVRGPKKPVEIAQEIARDSDVCFYLISSATEAENERMLAAVSKVNACSRVVPLDHFLNNPHYLSGALFSVKTTVSERLVPVTEVVGFVADDILFDFNSAELRAEYNQKKQMLVNFLQQNPDAYVVVGGYTDSVGDEEYNLGLSEQRAESVKRALTDAGIDEDRVTTLWFGEFNPVGDNATAEGRQMNRRVELAVGK